MSQELVNARQALGKVPEDIEQERLVAAATAVRDCARLFGRVPMMRNEHEEFSEMLRIATQYLARVEKVIEIFDANVVYQPGAEGALAELMNDLITALQDDIAREALDRHKEHKVTQLFKAGEEMKGGRLEEGRLILEKLSEDYDDDWQLAGEISDIFLAHGMYEESVAHLLRALKINGGSARILNRLGIVLRRQKRFDESNVYFARAVAVEQSDPNLFFNYARLFVDWEKWDVALDYAHKALDLAPDFSEAAKLAAYVERLSGIPAKGEPLSC